VRNSLLPEQILFIFCVQEFIHLRPAFNEYEDSSSKNRALQIGPKTQNGNFLENGSNDFNISVFMETIFLHKTA
jgi:hypothetical protein